MLERPLGIADLRTDAAAKAKGFDVSQNLPDHWYWCRRHERAEHVSKSPTQWSVDPPLIKTECIRIGPFMSEREANRLRDMHPEYPEGDCPLGMEVEV